MTEETGANALAGDIIADLDPKAYVVEAVMTNVSPETLLAFVTLVLDKVETVGGFDLSEYESLDDDDFDDEDDDEDGFTDDELDDRWPDDEDDDDDESDEP